MRGIIARTSDSANERNAFEIPLQWYGYALVALAVGITAIFGGLAAAPEAEATVVPLSEPLRNELFTAEIHNARLMTEIEEEGISADDGEVLVVADLTVTNDWNEPVRTDGSADNVSATIIGSGRQLLTVAGLPEDAIPALHRTDGSRGRILLQPDVPVDVTAVWTIPADAAPDDLTITVHAAELRHGAVLLSERSRWWVPGDAVMSTHVAVRDDR